MLPLGEFSDRDKGLGNEPVLGIPSKQTMANVFSSLGVAPTHSLNSFQAEKSQPPNRYVPKWEDPEKRVAPMVFL